MIQVLSRSYCLLPLLLVLMTTVSVADEPASVPTKIPPDHAARVKAGTELFRNSVRGILEERCLSCHGGDIVEGGFNLATRQGLLSGGDKGTAVIPGKLRDSRLYRLITHDAQPKMPYDEDKLPAAEIAAIAKWIELEAPYDRPLVEGVTDLKDWTQRTISEDSREFWSFGPLQNVQPPEVDNSSWCQTDIDRFVLHALEDRKLQPSDPAERRVLIRRAYFGLIGLPPAPGELHRLMHDESPDWYPRMVDELLDSQHFGERWARHWLDIARFAESHGFEQDYDREFAFHYRDFVIRAFNSDMPYDQFVRWQLAGDEIAGDNPLAMMATGFLGAGVFPTQLTEKEFEPARYDELDDMVSTMGTAMLGLTIGCARCHDHKFDPIPAADYYRLISTFATTIRSNVEVDMDFEQTKQAMDAWQEEHEPLVDRLREFETRELGNRLDQWLTSDAAATLSESRQPEWLILHPTQAASKEGATLTVQQDDSVLARGTNPDFDVYSLTAETHLRNIRHMRLEALSHESMVKGGPGRAANGNMGLSQITVTAEPLAGNEEPVTVTLSNPRATFEQNNSSLSIAGSLDEQDGTGWAVDPQFGRDHAAGFRFENSIGFEGGTRLTVSLRFHVNNKHNIGRARLAISQTEKPPALDAESGPQALSELLQLVASGTSATSAAHRQQLLSAYRTIDPEWNSLSAAVAEHRQSMPAPTRATVMVSSEGVKPIKHNADGRGFPHFYKETFFLKRGDTAQKVRPANPGFLQILTAPDVPMESWKLDPPESVQTSYRRRALANWMTDVDGGAGRLLARVIVNRLWQHHLGTGIVATTNDFGSQGERPSHPELLDWLAQKLIDEDWRLKPIHRLIVTSTVYQQKSEYDPVRGAEDPDNVFLWRRMPRRLEAEVIRDAMLAVSGHLDSTQFGPGTLNEGQKRRSIYFMIKRSRLIPMMQIFDFPEPLASVGSRPSTTIASQALMFMNNPHVREYAGGFAGRVRREAPADVVDQIYLTGLSRHPTKVERDAAEGFLDSQILSYMTDGKSDQQARELALTDFCQTIFSLNEFVFVE